MTLLHRFLCWLGWHKHECQLSVEPFYQCCCNCKYRVRVYRRWPWWLVRTRQILHLPKMPLHMPGKSWACVAYDLSGVEVNWPEHSCGCEIYTPRDGRKADRARAMALRAKKTP